MVTRTKRGKLELVEATPVETVEAVAPREKPKAFVFEDISVARDYYAQTGFHYLHNGYDKYDNLSGTARDMVDHFDDYHENRTFFGCNDQFPSMHSSQTPVQYVKVNPRISAYRLPRTGERIPFFTPYSVDELVSLFEENAARSRPISKLLPDTDGVSHNVLDENHEILTTVTRSRNLTVAPNTYRQTHVASSVFETTNPSHYPEGFGVMKMVKEKNGNYSPILQTIRCAMELVTNDNGRYSIMVDYGKCVAHTYSPSETDRFSTVLQTIGEIIQYCNIYTSITRRIDNVIFSNVHLKWDEIETDCPKDVNGNYYIRQNRKSVGNWTFDVIFAQGKYESNLLFLASLPKKTKEDFINEWVDRTLKTYRKELVTTEKTLIQLQSQLMQTSQDYGQKRLMVTMLQENGSAAFKKAIGGIENVPLVESVEFEYGCIIVTTEDLWYKKPRNSQYVAGDRAWMGKYRIYLSVTNGFMFYVNLHMNDDSAHPHSGGGSNSMCMGDYDGMIASAFRALDYELVVSAALSMLQDITETDSGARRRMMDLPPTKPKRGKISQRVFVFGNSDSVPADVPDERHIEEAKRLAERTAKYNEEDDEDEEDYSHSKKKARVEYDDDSDEDDDYDEDEDEEEEADDEEDEDY